MKRSLKSLLALAALVALTTAGSVSYACFMRSPQPVQVWLDHITINITDQVATKTYDCTFKNPNPRAVVGGTCYMELEPGAQIDNMSVLVDGKEMKAEILDVEKAKQIFTDIVKNGGSPALSAERRCWMATARTRTTAVSAYNARPRPRIRRGSTAPNRCVAGRTR